MLTLIKRIELAVSYAAVDFITQLTSAITIPFFLKNNVMTDHQVF